MAKRGRPRKPRLKLFAGEDEPRCPDWLDTVGKDEWQRVIFELRSMGILAKVDMTLIAAYCEAWAEFVELTGKIAKEGHTTHTPNGCVIQHPLVGAKNKASERLLKISKQFGISPLARSRIETQSNKKSDPLDDFISNAG